MSEKLHAAIDLSGKTAGFALLQAGKLLRSSIRPMRGRDSADFAPWIEGELKSAGFSLADVDCWTVGSGPGSFTGMRLAAALVSGWTFTRPESRTRCVPTAVALGAAVSCPAGGKVGTLFDGRNHELIYFELEERNGELFPDGVTAVLNAEQARTFFAERPETVLAVQAIEAEPVKTLLPADCAARVISVPELKLEALAQSTCQEFDCDLTCLVYIRPAVFTAPVC